MCSSQHTCATNLVGGRLLLLLLYKQCNTARITVQQYIVKGSTALHFPVHRMVVDSSHDLWTDWDSISRLNPKLFRVLNRGQLSWSRKRKFSFCKMKWSRNIHFLSREVAKLTSSAGPAVSSDFYMKICWYPSQFPPFVDLSILWSLDLLFSCSLDILISCHLQFFIGFSKILGDSGHRIFHRFHLPIESKTI